MIDANGRSVILPMTVPLPSLRGILPAPERPVSVEEMNEAMRRHVAERSS